MYSALFSFLLVLFFAVVFSIENPDPITVKFFVWTFEGSLVLVLVAALALGVMLSVVASLPSSIKKSRLIAKQQKTIATLERSVAELTHPPANT
ncbi:MAG: LapA family protein [Nitrospira sp.]|nr:LapA family protein [Nitrospira sp.]HBP90589.1 DUF1049 domain-containing protein [Nitrospiraceae bacterium]HNP29962.1 LapA family protein [Nitrospirales bacterium]